MLFFVETKNTLPLHRIVSRQGFRAGRAATGAKAQVSFPSFTARLKSCPDTKHNQHSKMSLRKAIKIRGPFPSEDAALKVMYLALRNLARK
jgi:hypothetical protein